MRRWWLLIDGIKEGWNDAPADLIRAIQQGMRQLGQYLPDFSNDNLADDELDAADITPWSGQEHSSEVPLY